MRYRRLVFDALSALNQLDGPLGDWAVSHITAISWPLKVP